MLISTLAAQLVLARGVAFGLFIVVDPVTSSQPLQKRRSSMALRKRLPRTTQVWGHLGCCPRLSRGQCSAANRYMTAEVHV